MNVDIKYIKRIANFLINVAESDVIWNQIPSMYNSFNKQTCFVDMKNMHNWYSISPKEFLSNNKALKDWWEHVKPFLTKKVLKLIDRRIEKERGVKEVKNEK